MKKGVSLFYCSILILTLSLLIINQLEAATFTVGSSSGLPGQTDVLIPIDLNSGSGEEVAAFNFDLNFDTLRLSFKAVTLGQVAIDAEKMLAHSTPSPNRVRVIVYGLNQNVIADGTVLNFTFDILSASPCGDAQLNITNVAIADPNANSIPATIVPGKIFVNCGDLDSDGDGVLDTVDNCPTVPNGPSGGTCTEGNVGTLCTSNDGCGTDGFCSMDQEDTNGNGIGDVCDETPCAITIYEGNQPGRRIIGVTCDKTMQFSFREGGACNTPCVEWNIEGGSSIGSTIGLNTGLYTVGADCASLDHRVAEEILAVDQCNGDISDTIIVTIGKVLLTALSTYAHPGDVGVKVDLCLDNRDYEVGGVQADICDVPDCLTCVGCELTERTVLFDCVALEQENGCCRVIIFSKHPGGVINPGICSIIKIDYTLCDSSDPECPVGCNAKDCIELTPDNMKIADPYGYPIASGGVPGEVCPFECGDVYPGESGPGIKDCGDGDVNIFDILTEVDFALGSMVPDSCQMTRADAPTGTPPNCQDPNGGIDIFDVMVIIDMALNRQDCCTYYYTGGIY